MIGHRANIAAPWRAGCLEIGLPYCPGRIAFECDGLRRPHRLTQQQSPLYQGRQARNRGNKQQQESTKGAQPPLCLLDYSRSSRL